jgi:Transglycosylase-like domain
VTNASLRLLVFAGLLLLVVVALTGVSNANAAGQRASVLDEIDGYRSETWGWQGLMRVKRTPTSYSELSAGESYREWLRDLWRARADRAEARAQDPPNERAWRCIQHHEASRAGGWAANTGNGYYGGLQMSRQFQRVLAPELVRRKGTADNWTALEQMWVAERALRRGFGYTPWPNTARRCGLA